MIFTFGSNEAGRHGSGAARFALEKKGAIWGRGYGHHGQSFAIPTKDRNVHTLPLSKIRAYVAMFKYYANEHPELTFQVTAIGCGLAGYHHKDIAPMFESFPSNCQFDEVWRSFLKEDASFWGTF